MDGMQIEISQCSVRSLIADRTNTSPTFIWKKDKCQKLALVCSLGHSHSNKDVGRIVRPIVLL